MICCDFFGGLCWAAGNDTGKDRSRPQSNDVVFCCATSLPSARTNVHRFNCFPSCLSSCEVASGAFCCPKAEDVRRKDRFQALATGLALDNGALSALHSEKKKADHTLHYHTFPKEACQRVNVTPVFVPKGGLPEGDRTHSSQEEPRHEVTVYLSGMRFASAVVSFRHLVHRYDSFPPESPPTVLASLFSLAFRPRSVCHDDDRVEELLRYGNATQYTPIFRLVKFQSCFFRWSWIDDIAVCHDDAFDEETACTADLVTCQTKT